MTLSRRSLLARTTALTAAVCLPSLLSSPAHAATPGPDVDRLRASIRKAQARNKKVLSGEFSRNGWEMEKTADAHGHIYTRPVPGTPLDGVQVRIGDVEAVLTHVVQRFHYEIDQLRKGDVLGWRAPDTVHKRHPESNQASGTAVQIRPGFYPAGAKGGFFTAQLRVLRDILAELDGVVRWGGDDRHVDESLFYVGVKPGDARLTAVVTKLRDWKATPGEGAGAPVDVLAAGRRRAAEKLRRHQRRTAA
ncbi:hypothetical protein [Streptomyces sediminimaris]|uniref:hypothetical protein n=1 Tax=Streptomyces sediminimaris TaxID=3383721 RepID=UPI00399BA922